MPVTGWTTDDLEQMKRGLRSLEQEYASSFKDLPRTDRNVVTLSIVCRVLIERVQDLEAMVKEMSDG